MIKSLSTSSRIILAVSTLTLFLGIYLSFLAPYLANTHAAHVYEQATTELAEVEASASLLTGDLAQRTSYLDTYIIDVGTQNSAAQAPLWAAKDQLEKAALASQASDKTRSVEAAQLSLQTARTAIANARARLAEIDTAYQNAGTELAKATSTLPKNITYVTDVIRTSGFNRALQPAIDKNVEAGVLLQTAMTASTTSIGGKYDLVAVYTNAHTAFVTTSEAVAYADGQMSLYKSNLGRINALSSNRQSFASKVNEPRALLATLESYHAPSSWSQVYGYDSSIEKEFRKSADYLRNAVLKNSITEQDFTNAASLLGYAETSLTTALRQLNELAALRDQLEQYREGWWQKENDVASSIEDERSNVRQYAAYSPDAVSDFNDGIDYFDSAVAYAENADYRSAWSAAENAKRSVDGTGYRAKKAYDDYQSEQAAAAKRTADNAAILATSPTDDGGILGGGDTDLGGGDTGAGDIGGGDGGDFGGGDTGGGDGGDF